MPDPGAHRVLASVSRVAVLEVLRRSGGPLGVLELAEVMGLHPNTVRKHLELLLEYGHVTRLRDESGKPGRPRQVYALAAMAASPQRNYRMLASVMASYLRGTEDPTAAAQEAGRKFGAELVELWTSDETRPTTAASVERIVRMLDEIGFQPEVTADRSAIRLRHCPFHELARDQPDIVCGIHLGLIRGALEQLGAPVEATRLLPFITPTLCVVELEPPPPRRVGGSEPTQPRDPHGQS